MGGSYECNCKPGYMKQFGSSKAECVPDELENRLQQIAQMHKNGYQSVIGTRVVKATCGIMKL